MSRNLFTFFIVIGLMIVSGSAFAQVPDSMATGGGDIVDLTQEAVIIKAEPDRPRVNIIADRIKPEFDNINLDKSFLHEILGRGERIVIVDRRREEDIPIINIEKILNRSR